MDSWVVDLRLGVQYISLGVQFMDFGFLYGLGLRVMERTGWIG